MVKSPYRDAQDQRPDAVCTRCEAELFDTEAEPDGFGHVLCPVCREAMERRYDPKTVKAVLEAVDGEVSKYLSEDLRDTIWNAMVKRFREAEAS